MTLRALGFAAVALAVIAGCSGSDTAKPAPESTYTREKLLDPATCNECHQDHYKEWAGSMHAYAAKDPLFRAMNKRGQEEAHIGNFCINCHAPMAVNEMSDGGETTIDPETIPEKLSGINCYFCHNAVDVAGTHNNPILLANDVTMRGNINDREHPALQYKAHRVAYSPLHDGSQLKSANLCGACHDIVVPNHFGAGDAGTPVAASGDGGVSPDGIALERTFQEWKGSVFGSGPPQAERTCGQCHMDIDPRGTQPIASPPEPHPPMPSGRIRHMHDFPAVDTAFSQPDFPTVDGGAAIRAAQLQRVQQKLDGELRVELCVDVQQFSPIHVTLENLFAGHNFPSGASQDRRLWIEIDEEGSNGKTYQSGFVAPGASAVAAADTAANAGLMFALYRDVTTKADGTPAHMFWDVKSVHPNVIPVGTPLEITANTREIRIGEAETRIPAPTRVALTVWLEPVGRDVIDDLVASGHLQAGGPEATSLPRFALIPSRLTETDSGATPVTLVWTPEKAKASAPTQWGECVQTGPKP